MRIMRWCMKEEYEDYALVQFVPLTLWKKISGVFEPGEEEVYIRVIAEDRENPEALWKLEEEIQRILAPRWEGESENRLEERLANDRMLFGYRLILGCFCAILALIGGAGVFSYTLGLFLYAGFSGAEEKGICQIPVDRSDSLGAAQNFLHRGADDRGKAAAAYLSSDNSGGGFHGGCQRT